MSVNISEYHLKNKEGKVVGKLSIFTSNAHNPYDILNKAVEYYVGDVDHSQWIDISCGDPHIRVVTSDINKLDYQSFDAWLRIRKIGGIIND